MDMYKGEKDIKVESVVIENFLLNVKSDIDKMITSYVANDSIDVLDIKVNIREDRKSALITFIFKEI